MKGKDPDPFSFHFLNRIKAGPIWGAIHPLSVKEMPEIRRETREQDPIGISSTAVKQLYLFDRIVKLCVHTPYMPALFILTPLVLLILGRNKI